MSISTALVKAVTPHVHHMSGLLSNTSHYLNDGIKIAHNSLYGVYLEPFKINFMMISGLCLIGKSLAKRASALESGEGLPIVSAPQSYWSSERGWFLTKKIALYAGAALCFSLAAYELYHTVSEYHSIGKAGNCQEIEGQILKASNDLENYKQKEALVEAKSKAHYDGCKDRNVTVCPAYIHKSYTFHIAHAQEQKELFERFYKQYDCPSLSGRDEL